MKILHIISSYRPNALYEENLSVKAQLILGHDVHVMCSHNSLGKTNVSRSRHDFVLNSICYAYTVYELPSIRLLFNQCILLRLSRYIKLLRPDLIYLHGLDTLTHLPLAFTRAMNANIVIIADVHETGIHPNFRANGCMIRLRNMIRMWIVFIYLFRLSIAKVVTFSSFTSAPILSFLSNFKFLGFCFEEKFHTLSMPSILNEVNFSDDIFCSVNSRSSSFLTTHILDLAFVGSYSSSKFIEYSVCFLLSACPPGIKLRFTFVGSGYVESKSSILAIADHPNISKCIFMMPLDSRDLCSFYSRMHASVWISNISVGINESIASLCPVITTDFGYSFYPCAELNFLVDPSSVISGLNVLDRISKLWSSHQRASKHLITSRLKLNDYTSKTQQSALLEKISMNYL